MKILYISSFYTPDIIGGAEKSLQILVEAIHNRGHEVIVAATTHNEGMSEEIINGIKVYRANINNIYWHYEKEIRSGTDKLQWHIKDSYNRKMGKYIKNIIEIEKPDIVSCHNLSGWSISVWDVLYEAKIPIVQVLHDFYLLCINSNMYKNDKQCKTRCLKCSFIKSLHKVKSNKVDAVVGVSQYILKKVIDAGYFKNSLTATIYNARILQEELALQKVLKDKEANITLGFIGTLAPNKGVEWLIKEFKKIKLETLTLKIAGEARNNVYLNFLEDYAKEDPRISFVGYQKSENFYKEIDVLVVPSVWEEPLGMVAIEACANGIPVITSGTGGLKEIIIDGVNGILCNPNIKDSLSNAIHQINNDRELLNDMKENARHSVLPFLDTNRLGNEYEDLYNKIANK
ncbi:glycosyltransferase [Dysgonomonas sp. 521]|uniref:glycosyltransferase family 4 protein n=1 Tax=Dysgonomonas sp. 521 TaxID=2302932 RepID=UPI0013D606BC|nr:glycosyltransferase family 4 protein [Dysgonomonas sp. 521]NDV96116.1 glycosyltransferase [Dysgonomonas sp. 521]